MPTVVPVAPSQEVQFDWPFEKLTNSARELANKVAQTAQREDALCRARDEAKHAAAQRERVLLAENAGDIPADDELTRLRDAHAAAKQAVEAHRNEVDRVKEVLRAVNAELRKREQQLDGDIQRRCYARYKGKWPEARQKAIEALVEAIKAKAWDVDTANPEAYDPVMFVSHPSGLDLDAIIKLLRKSIEADRAKGRADAILLSNGMLGN